MRRIALWLAATIAHLGLTVFWVSVWLGAWIPVSSLLAALPVVGSCVAWARGRALDERLRARLIFAAASAVVIGAHLALLAGVPWSSLEWTLGFSLRCALPPAEGTCRSRGQRLRQMRNDAAQDATM